MPQSIQWSLSQLRRCITAELEADRTADEAEAARRSTWWATTLTLAACPRDKWGRAMAEYVQRTGHSQSHAKARRSTGQRLGQSPLASTLPPRMAQAGALALGLNATAEAVEAMTERIRQAEVAGLSLREFAEQVTGRSWTSAPEDMSEEQEDAVVRRVVRRRPRSVARTLAAQAPEEVATVAEEPAVRQVRAARARERWERDGWGAVDRGLQNVADNAADNYRRRLYGTDDADVQANTEAARGIVDRDLARGQRGDAITADYVGSLTTIITAATAARDRATGTSTSWSDDDRALLQELGVTL